MGLPKSEEDLALQLRGYAATTAEILYHMPDHPGLLQTFIWQEYDLAPKFPRLREFLDFWSSNLDGPLYRVRVAHRRLVGPREFRFLDGELKFH
ncbi:MAG: usg protein [Hyphomicrobiales bacterium]|nr:usg protein [Hyphomicrobiales bacterium]